MLKQRNRSATVVCAILPGAGHMLMGFMKRGVSFMGLFFLVIFLSSWLRIGPLLYLLPVLWFYAFFECLNIAWASAEEFSHLHDSYLFQPGNSPVLNGVSSRRWAFYGGILLVFFGVYLVLDKFAVYSTGFLSDYASSVICMISSILPQIFFGVVIILIGIRLIVGKKKELENRD